MGGEGEDFTMFNEDASRGGLGVDAEEREELLTPRAASTKGVQTYHKQLLELNDGFRVGDGSRCSEATMFFKKKTKKSLRLGDNEALDKGACRIRGQVG